MSTTDASTTIEDHPAPTCALCQDSCAQGGDDFCHGCRRHICKGCLGDLNESPWGKHKPSDHPGRPRG